MEQLGLIALLLKCFLRNRKLLWLYGISAFVVLSFLGFLLAITAESAVGYQSFFNWSLSLVIQISLIAFFVVAFEFSREVFDKEREFLFCVRDYGQLKVASAVFARDMGSGISYWNCSIFAPRQTLVNPCSHACFWTHGNSLGSVWFTDCTSTVFSSSP